MHRMIGAGLTDVFLFGGVHVSGRGDDEEVTYNDLDGLYRALALAIAKRLSFPSAAEFRFLRKRMGLSQTELGARFQKDAQTVAKWEKGSLPVPAAEGGLVKFLYLGTHDPQAALMFSTAWLGNMVSACNLEPYPMHFGSAGWIYIGSQMANTASNADTTLSATTALGYAGLQIASPSVAANSDHWQVSPTLTTGVGD